MAVKAHRRLVGLGCVEVKVTIMSMVRHYLLCDLRDEVKALVEQGRLSKKQKLYSLCTFFDYRDWLRIERLLEENDFLLRDTVLDLIGQEIWLND